MTFEKYTQRTLHKLENAVELYGKHIFVPILRPSTVYALETPEHLRRPPARESMKPIEPGTGWGGEYRNIWLETEIEVPLEAEGKCLCAAPDADAVEVLCFKNGKPSGIINSKNRFIGGNHSVMFVCGQAKAKERIALAFECYAGHTCLGTQPTENPDMNEEEVDQAAFMHTYRGVTVYAMDEDVKNAVFDLASAVQLAGLNADNYASQWAFECLQNAFSSIIQDEHGLSQQDFTESAKKISAALKPLMENCGEASRGRVYVTGHSHMDTAWLWPVSETIRKCARTYSQALKLMELYPDYTFIQSSALHLDWMRTYYPDIFEGIKQRVAEGRYEPNGGVWVECDCNITGGEAMARQFIYGQRFTRKYLNYTSDSFWLPDTFGYNAAIPQIMLQSGVKYFFTTKLSWNDLNTFPAGSFVWKGIDGSEVLCHLNATHSIPDPRTVTNNYAQVSDRRTEQARFAAYGFGDGGGGPTYGMLEYLERVKKLPGMPKVESASASHFMQQLDKRRERLPLCDGELYLELHRGTLTKMHDVKKNNRLAEIALHDYEAMSVLLGADDTQKREAYWKILLKNQFHDILPGTCIPRVYEQEIPEMNALITDLKADTQSMAGQMAATRENAISLFNTLSFARQDEVVLEGETALAGCPSQSYTDMEGKVKTVSLVKLAPLSFSCFETAQPAAAKSAFTVEGDHITTPFYTLRLDENGLITELYDKKARRSVSAPGAALGALLAGEEMPAAWDNWDIDDDAFKKLAPAKALGKWEIVSQGEVELRIRASYAILRGSRAVVDTVLYAFSRRIDYEVKLDWQERHGLLKAAFDLDIRSAFVKNEIQFGSIDRPTTRNNSIEAAKFEVCNQKWSDLSESRYGVALLNDCKYGMSALGGTMCLTLMKGGARPDPVTDRGVHTMRYSLLPHEGAFSAENTVQPAYQFNFPPVAVPGALDTAPLFVIDAPNILCEAVKPAEDVENAYVLRLYECERNHTRALLKLGRGKKAYLTNFLEEKQQELNLNEELCAEMEFRPYEIKTVLVEL